MRIEYSSDGPRPPSVALAGADGSPRLERAVHAAQGKTANEARDTILAEVASFSAGTPQFDDMAIFILRRTPGSA